MDETKFNCHCCVFNRGNYCEADGDCFEGEKHGNKEVQTELSVRDIYKMAIDTYGRDNQLNVAIEEMAELIQAINKTRRYPNNLKAKEDVAEEIADVFIMLEQLILIYDCDELVDNIKDLKVRRLLKRLIDN